MRHASTVDGVLFTAVVGVPSVVQGLFTKREKPTRLAGLVGGDQHTFRTVRGLVNKYGPEPFFIRMATDEVVLAHHPDDIKFVLEGSPDPFASDFGSKRKGMVAFQPEALTLSRMPVWEQRRRFAEAILDTGKPLHRLAEPMLAAAKEEANHILDLSQQRKVKWSDINEAFQRLTRIVVFGKSAADDTAITAALKDLMGQANNTPGKTSDDYPAFIKRVQHYLDRAESGSLAGLIADTAVDGVDPAGQVVHWLFAMGDTLAANVTRALALLATHPDQRAKAVSEVQVCDLDSPAAVASLSYLSGCLLEAMRLYPTTGLFGRVAIRDVMLPSGKVIPEGTQVLIPNMFAHRNADIVSYADRFAPEEWASGDAGSNWSFNFFSHGPQGCPGAGMAIFLGTAFLAQVLNSATPKVSGTTAKAGRKLPYGMDLYPLEFEFV
ncbi:cytochrome P450 [Skermania sp. ID1734]|nr:cytochrome P450 [Skermania sp. ID1734]